MSLETNKYSSLLDYLAGLKLAGSRVPTILELSGYPHFENVCSNILAFYFDPEREHGLHDLFLQGLLEICEREHTSKDFQEVEVNREETTANRGRIDIVIRTETLVIGIEVKIYAGISNDLEDYANYIEQEAMKSNRDSVLVLLSLRELNTIDLAGFYPIRFESYFNSIRKIAGQYMEKANHHYFGFMLDFIKTIDNLEEGASMDTELIKFLDKRRADAKSFFSILLQYKRELRSIIQKLGSMIELPELVEPMNISQWYYRKSEDLFDILVHDFSIDGEFMIAVDTMISPGGWITNIWPRHGEEKRFMDWINERGISVKLNESDGKYIVDESEMYFTEGLDFVAERLQNLLNKLCEGA